MSTQSGGGETTYSVLMDTLSPGTLTQLSKCQAKGRIPNIQCTDIYLIKENFILEFPVLRFQKDYLLRGISSHTLPKIRKASLSSQMGRLAPSNTFFITNLLFYPFAEFEQVMALKSPCRMLHCTQVYELTSLSHLCDPFLWICHI